jgi:hypothetical protein
MSFQDNKCPCGGKKPNGTMLCDSCEAEFSGTFEMKVLKDATNDFTQRRSSAIKLLTMARRRTKSLPLVYQF